MALAFTINHPFLKFEVPSTLQRLDINPNFTPSIPDRFFIPLSTSPIQICNLSRIRIKI